MNVNYINPFITAAKSVLNSMLGMDVVIEKPRVDPIEFNEDSEVVLIGITGEVKGQVFLGFDKPVACHVSSTMMGMTVTEIDEIAESAIAELANMMMGNTATQFSQNKMVIDITPPTVAKGKMRFDTKGIAHITIPIALPNGMVISTHIALK